MYCLHWDLLASWRIAKCTRRLFKVRRNWPNSKWIRYTERGDPRLSFEYKFVGHPWKLLKLYQTVDSYLFFGLHAVFDCFHWEHQQVEGLRSAHGGSLRYEGIGRIQNWYVILKGENLAFHLNINLSATLENFKNYTQPYMHICFSSHCIVLFPLRTPASWRSAKCTRRLFKVWRNLPNSKLICYSERGEPML